MRLNQERAHKNYTYTRAPALVRAYADARSTHAHFFPADAPGDDGVVCLGTTPYFNLVGNSEPKTEHHVLTCRATCGSLHR